MLPSQPRLWDLLAINVQIQMQYHLDTKPRRCRIARLDKTQAAGYWADRNWSREDGDMSIIRGEKEEKRRVVK
jgi:hypothetical protein